MSSPASWTTRGEDHPTARLLDLVPGRSGTVHENWLEERGEQFRSGILRSGIQIATVDPFQGYKNAIAWPAPRTPPASSVPSISSSSLATLQVRCVARVQQDTTGHRRCTGDPLYPGPQSFARLTHASSPHVKRNASVRPSRQMRHTSVSKSPTFTGQVGEVFHQATPAQGQRLAAHLIQRLPACPVPEIARLGADPTQVEGRLLGLLLYRRSQQRLHGSYQRTLSSWADAPPEATATPPATNSECSSSQEV